MLGELLEILKLLEAEDITTLSNKRAGSGRLFYGNIALRQFGDIDMFVYRDMIKISEKRDP